MEVTQLEKVTRELIKPTSFADLFEQKVDEAIQEQRRINEDEWNKLTAAERKTRRKPNGVGRNTISQNMLAALREEMEKQVELRQERFRLAEYTFSQGNAKTLPYFHRLDLLSFKPLDVNLAGIARILDLFPVCNKEVPGPSSTRLLCIAHGDA